MGPQVRHAVPEPAPQQLGIDWNPQPGWQPVPLHAVNWQPVENAAELVARLNAPSKLTNTSPPVQVGENPAFDVLFEAMAAQENAVEQQAAVNHQALDQLLRLDNFESLFRRLVRTDGLAQASFSGDPSAPRGQVRQVGPLWTRWAWVWA